MKHIPGVRSFLFLRQLAGRPVPCSRLFRQLFVKRFAVLVTAVPPWPERRVDNSPVALSSTARCSFPPTRNEISFEPEIGPSGRGVIAL